MVQINGRNAVELSEDLVRHMILNSIRGINKKFRKEYGELVIASDGKHSWRKQVFPNYKANRKKTREQSGHDWETIFDVINRIKSELKEFMPYKLLELETAEADDVIAVLIRKIQRVVGPNHAKKILIVSGDKDFIQLHSDDVRQYNPILNKYVGKDENPSIYIREHILKGDRSDGVPNILSPDDTFTENKRQKPMRKVVIGEVLDQMTAFDVQDLYMLAKCPRDTWIRNWQRNATLIDLTFIPPDIQDKILKEYDSVKIGSRSGLLDYFIDNRLNSLVENIGDF